MQSYIYFDFDFKKATQALNYLAKNFGGKINKMQAIKLIYFADRYHLRKYGRPVTNDEYVAMKYGPVGSKTKDIAEQTDFLDDNEKGYCINFIQRDNYNLLSINEIEEQVFSDSDKEALDFVIKNLGQFNQFQLADISHAYPEWKRYRKEIECQGHSSITMHYEDFLNDPEPDDPHIRMHLNNQDIFRMPVEEINDMREYLQEQQKIKNLWE